MQRKTMMVMGATGFVGTELVREAVARGWAVRGLARGAAAAARLRAIGAEAVPGDASRPGEWVPALAGCDVLVDLVQPALPARIGSRQIGAVSQLRQRMTAALLQVLAELPACVRPLLVSASGTDDLAPDGDGRVDGSSALRERPVGFGHVGIPVRRMVQASGVEAAFLHLGTVYGPGKSFASAIFPRLAKGHLLLPGRGRNQMPLIHVSDAAGAIVHLLELRREQLSGRAFVLVDREGGAGLAEFFSLAARLMGVSPPRRLPAWALAPLAGRVLVETMTRDLRASSDALQATGFEFRYPSFREGLPATLRDLGLLAADAPSIGTEARGEGDDRRRHGQAAAGRRPAPELLAESGTTSDPPRRSSRLLLAAAVAAFVAVNTVDFPLSVRQMRRLAGGSPMLDLRAGYSPTTAYALLQELGASGRRAYLTELWTVDLVLPLLFSLFLWTASGRGRLARGRFLALAAGALDYAENAAITGLLAAFPTRHDGLAWTAAALTSAKLAAYAVATATAALSALPGREALRWPRRLPRRPAEAPPAGRC